MDENIYTHMGGKLQEKHQKVTQLDVCPPTTLVLLCTDSPNLWNFPNSHSSDHSVRARALYGCTSTHLVWFFLQFVTCLSWMPCFICGDKSGWHIALLFIFSSVKSHYLTRQPNIFMRIYESVLKDRLWLHNFCKTDFTDSSVLCRHWPLTPLNWPVGAASDASPTYPQTHLVESALL